MHNKKFEVRNFDIGRELFTIHPIKTRWRLPVSSYFSTFFFYEIIYILLTVIKVTFLNSVNIYLQDVPVISVRLVVISVSFLVISVIPGDFGNSWHRTASGNRKQMAQISNDVDWKCTLCYFGSNNCSVSITVEY